MSLQRSFARLTTAAAIALLALTPFAAAQAGDGDASKEEVTLIGLLDGDPEYGLYLVEEESGESIPLEGPASLAEHLRTRVAVTGTWAEADDGTRYLRVSKVESA